MTTLVQHILDVLSAVSTPAPLGIVGAASGWRLGVGRMTDDPDTQVCLYDGPGELPNPKWLLEYPYIQVMVRGTVDGYAAANQKMSDVYDVLLGHPPIDFIEGDRIDGITVASNPSFIGNDQKNRPLLSANFRFIYEPVASGYANRQPL